jgi:4-amino-4-deoxychorismate lyase
MCRFFESIKIDNNEIFNLPLHTRRLNATRRDMLEAADYIDLADVISIPDQFRRGLYKCRIVYSREIIDIQFHPYTKRSINSFKLVHDNDIEYSHKFEDKKRFEQLLRLKEPCDDIIIAKNNRITDTSFSNIAFYDGNKWITPATPLLNGTKREKLLQEGRIIEDEITVADLSHFKKASLINAMLELGERVIDVENIVR